MGFIWAIVWLRVLIEGRVDKIVPAVWDNIRHVVFSPAPGAARIHPIPTKWHVINSDFAAALSATADDYEVLRYFVAVCIEGSKRGESFLHLPDQ